MLRTRILSSLGLGLVLTAAACTVTSTTNNTAGDGGSSGSSGSSSGSSGGVDGGDGGSTTLSFKPSNIDLTGWDLSKIGAVDLSGTNCIIDDEEADGLTTIPCDTDISNHVAHKIVTLADQTKLSVYVMASLRIEASTVLSLSRGHLPIVLVTTGSMELLGSIEAAPGQVGGAFNSTTASDVKGVGTGGGTAGDATGLAGGGGSYCGLGGKGGTFTGTPAGTAPPAPTPAYGTPALVPLVPGSAGGNGDLTNDGQGGGAVQLVAGTSFNLHAGAHLSAGGGGGQFGGIASQPSGAGGSGGAILIESPTVTIAGSVGANGGGGGQGNGDHGEDGHPDIVAKGGHKATGSGPGGDGAFGPNVNGGDGASASTTSAAGGGGGAGRVRINSTSGAAAITGAVSPDATTPCFTQGKLGS